MAATWVQSRFPGVRYREHPTRRVRGHADRYLVIRYRVDGRRIEEKIGWESQGFDEAWAYDKLCSIQRNVAQGQGPRSMAEMRARADIRKQDATRQDARTRRDSLTVSDLAGLYLKYLEQEQRDAAHDTTRLQLHVLPRIGSLCAADMSLHAMRQLKAALARSRVYTGKDGPDRTMADSTLYHCLQVIRRIFNWAATTPLDENHPDIMLFAGQNPCTGLDMPQPRNARIRIFWADEEARLWPALLDADRNVYEGALLSRRTGLRLEEVCLLQAQHAEPGMHLVRAVDTKNNDTRAAYPDQECAAFLKRRAEAAKAAGHGWLFPGLRGKGPLNKHDLSRDFIAQVDALGLNAGVTDRRVRLVFHSLRHTFATEMALKGVGLLALKQMLGHRTTVTTERYVHLAEDILRQQQAQAVAQGGFGVVRPQGPAPRPK